MGVTIHNRCSDFNTYRAARVKSLFNAETGCNFDLETDLPIDDAEWKIGVVVGPSGSGKTSIGNAVWGGGCMFAPEWPTGEPIIDAIARGGDFNDVTSALAAVGLGDVPAWLRPYPVLSNGEKFRADMARLISEAPARAVVDEFTSVVDRQIAKFGALAFAKAWRRTAGQVVLLSCHYDILDWVEPDWVFNTETKTFHGRWLQQGRHDGGAGWYKRPKFELEIWQTDWRYWPEFEPHHYLKLPLMPCAKCYVGIVNGERVAHLAVSSKNDTRRKGRAEARACRMVVKPEWQGAGVGMRMLNTVCDLYLKGLGHLRYPATTQFHTSHPGLCAALRRDKRWRQVSAELFGANKRRSAASLSKTGTVAAGFGGHFRAVQGFRYYGEQAS